MESIQFKSTLGVIEITGDDAGIQTIRIQEEHQIREQPIPEVLEASVEQLKEYIEGSRTTFTFLMNPKGTEFQKQVWNILLTIPFGKTLPYTEVAQIYGNTKAVRAVAAAIGKNPILVAVPCHRVIGSNGSLVGFAAGLEKKKWLLENEGFPFQAEIPF
ncbi:MAG: cysteine methyltransferase [Candidatus Arcticimaribacter sp.]|nr:MAG: cysteine methyltransferase [Candidatus Arcticimaribacter sp.]PTM00991.1 MAG: cysteine methyltransferase [Candidatus Arcticimaribacter sp.]